MTLYISNYPPFHTSTHTFFWQSVRGMHRKLKLQSSKKNNSYNSLALNWNTFCIFRRVNTLLTYILYQQNGDNIMDIFDNNHYRNCYYHYRNKQSWLWKCCRNTTLNNSHHYSHWQYKIIINQLLTSMSMTRCTYKKSYETRITFLIK